MATAGEAASLFGAADSANDPFALPPPEEPQPTGNDPFANVQPTTEAADLFGYAAPQEPTQTSQQGYTPSHVAAEGTSTNWNGSSVQQAASSSSQDPYAYAPQNTYVPQAATNGWNETHSQWSGYNAQQQYASANGAYTNGSYAQAASVHDPYASQTNYAYAPSKAVSPSTTQPSTYAPYAPSANGYNAYTPATTSHATSYEQSYDPYKPSQAAPAQHVGQSSSTYAQFVNGSAETVPQVEAPARGAAAAAQYRPKTFNAYDPPIPPPKAAPKRSAAWQSPVTSPAQVAYSSLPGSPPVRSAQSPALPPPPRKASVPPPPPRTGSAARQYAGSPVPPPLPHAHAPYGVHQPPPPNATPPPPRTGSAARHFATPPLPSTQYNSPPASSYIPSPPSHQSAPPPPVYQSPPPPSTYQSPSPPSAYQPPPPPSAYASHQPPPQETVSPATVTPPITQDPYGPGNVADHSHPASEIPAETSGADAAESPWDEIPTQAVEEAGNPPTEHIPSDSVFDPEADEVEREAVDHTTGKEEAVSLTSVPETHEHHPASTGLEAVADEEYDPEGGQLEEDEGYKVDAHANASEAYVPQTSPPQPASIASAAPAESVYDPYRPAPAPAPAVPPYGNAGNNPYSPPAPSAYSPRQSAEADRPTAVSSPPSAAPAPRSSVGSYAPSPYAYEPASTAAIPRTASPSSFSVRSSKSTHSVHDPYAPTIPSTISTGARYRSMSNGSMLSTTSVPEDPYAPAPHSRQQSTDSYSYSVSHATPSLEDDSSLVTPTTSSHAQVVTLTAPTRSQYAPSPSLLGSNDPLGRTSVRVPVFTFGFGGKIVTCFHGSEMLQTGFDVAMSSKASTSLRLRQLSSIIPQSAMETSTATYPGPLFSDPGTPTTTLVRPGAAAHAKAKKAKVVKYLEERAEEITQGLGYLHQGSVELYRAEAKRALINMVKVMVENDGKLSGTPQIDAAVRAVLVPGTEPASESSEPGTAGVRSAFELTSSSYGSPSSLGYDSKGVKLADHPLWSAQLDKIETLLVRGDRRGAFHYAADEKLWAHAMVIASSIDKEAWKEVVTEFVRSELSGAGAVNGVTATPGKPPSVDRREPLRVAYSLFAGQGSGSVQELHPPKALGTATQSLSAIPATFSASTPLSAGFQQPVQPVELSKDVLMKWPTTAAMMIGSPLTVESSSALTALGDHLAFNGWHEAAHVCYLLSPQTSLAGGVGTPGGRVVLYGSPSPAKVPTVCKDPDAVIFSEIVEYALSLATPSKGQEPFHGLAYLQPYRLLRATYLAELGHIGLAKRYCEAISSSINRPSPYLNITFLEQLKDLTDRLIAAPMMDKSGSWIGSKMAKPSLDKIGNWLEGRFTSFIAGEGDSPNPAHNSSKVPTFSGPFAHFSSISSATNSTMPSPHMSSTNLADMQAQAQPAAPPFRTGSAMALRTSTTSPAQIARASSAIDYLRRKPSPVPRVSSAGVSPVSTLSAQSPYGYPNGYAASSRPDMSTPTVQEDAGERSAGPQIASWWGAGESESATPTATTFAHPDEAQQPSSSEGFISLIDTPGFSGPSSTTQAQFTAAAQAQSIGQDALDDEEDLGFGNNSSRKKSSPEAPTEPGKADATPAPAAEKPKEAEKPAASGGGWLSRLWKRSDSSGPVKANLGEENTFYYDPEQKRWVNKNAPPEAAKPTPPPPPPARAQTASPGMASARGPPPPSPMHPPPARPATAIDLTDGPSRKPPMRIRSNLAPPEGSSAPTTPGSAPPPPRTPNTMMDGPPGLDAPPTPGARRAPAKRNARNRYVDVFQQQ